MRDLIVKRKNLSAIPTQELRRELAQAVGITAKALNYLAQIWRELEHRGEDLSDLRAGLMCYLPLIADGRLDPELVIRCAGQAMLLKSAAELPLDEQRKLLTEGVVIAEIGQHGELVEVRRPLEQLSSAEVRRLFSGGEIRAPRDQAKFFEEATPLRNVARGVIVKVRLTQQEYKNLRARAAAAKKHVPTYVRERVLEVET